jgi:shikimate kinase
MCSGKSRVGRELATRLGWSFQDTDDIVAKSAGARVADIIRKRGEPEFRRLEADAVRRAAESDRSVIATGGGVPLNPDNMKVLGQNGQIVWLKVAPRTVLRRAGDLSARPLIDASDPLGSVTKRLREREPAYETASFAVETDSSAADEVVEKILNLFPGIQ